ncbi:MAG: Gfo/Idh/MocA family protein [Planctomycetota bacterium]|jgi:predicted dehydrogenase
MSSKLKIGVIGLGARGETFARQLYAGGRDFELFGLCDIDEERTKIFCEYCEIEGAKTFTDPDEFLNHPDLDAVIITTPDFRHTELAETAFAAGKHVYLDKPLEVTVDRCRRILEAEKKSKGVGFLGFNLREAPARIKTKEIIASGLLGQIIHIEGLEQLKQSHSASFTRRFHRKVSQSGGFLNTKCSLVMIAKSKK